MNLNNQTEQAWMSKSDTELKELIKKGVSEANKRAKTTTLRTEKQFIKDIEKMQGVIGKGAISTKTAGLSHKELVYRARKVDQYLTVDKSSSQAFKELNAMNESARNTFNDRYDTNLSKKEYKEMVELMGAFKDQTQAMGSTQIQTFVEYAGNANVSADKLAEIFGKAEDKTFRSEQSRIEYIFDEIDKLRG